MRGGGVVLHTSDGSSSIGGRAAELMRTYSASASPRSYELWYTYVTGVQPALNKTVKDRIASNQILSGDDVESLHEEFLAPARGGADTERTGTRLIVEMDQVMSLIGAAMGSTANYGASLEAISSDLSGVVDANRLAGVVEALMAATRQVADTNTDLEARLRSSRDEIKGLQQALEAARIEGLTDALTAIPNRKHFETTLAATVARASAEGSWAMLIAIDIDRFKRFNDTYGHLTGDQVLRLVASAMRENVGPGATLARCGGEEFAIILPEICPDDAYACAEKIRKNVMGRELLRRSTGESLGRVTISLGIAALRPNDTAVSFVERADQCMYRAKQTGRNRTVTDWDTADAAAPLSSAAA